ALLVEFEFNSIGRRLFGEDFKAGRGFQTTAQPAPTKSKPRSRQNDEAEDLILTAESQEVPPDEKSAVAAPLKNITNVPHDYRIASSPSERAALIQILQSKASFCFDTETTSLDPKQARVLGLAFSFAPH